MLEFSQTHCVTICSVLVPAILIATSATIGLVFWQHPQQKINISAGVSALLAIALLLHVSSWFMIGVVAVQTYILICLAIVSLSVNTALVAASHALKT